MQKKSYVYLTILTLLIGLSIITSCTNNPFYGVGDSVDTRAPEVSVISPSNGYITSGKLVITGTTADDTGIKTIDITSKGFKKRIKPAQEWTAEIDISGFETEGDHRLEITAIDEANRETSVFLNVVLDKSPPEIEIATPVFDKSEELKQLVGTINVTGIAEDAISLIKNGSPNNKLVIYPVSGNENNPTHTEEFTKSPWAAVNINTNEFEEEGEYIIKVTFEDNVGNIATRTEHVMIVHEVDIPSLVIDIPDPAADIPPVIDKQLVLHGYAHDNIKVEKIYYNIQNEGGGTILPTDQVITPEITGEFSQTIDITTLNTGVGLPNGSYLVYAYAEDDGGRQSGKMLAAFTVDKSVPVVTILDAQSDPTGDTPAAATYLNQSIPIDITCRTLNTKIDYIVFQGDKKQDWTTVVENTSSEDTVYRVTIDVDTLKSTYAFNDGDIVVKFRGTKKDKVSYSSRAFKIDNTPPVIELSPPFNNPDIPVRVNGAVTIGGSVYDPGGELNGALTVHNQVDGWQELAGTTVWSYVLGTDLIGEEVETRFNVTKGTTKTESIRIKACDKAGNETIKELDIIIDPNSDYPSIKQVVPATSGERVSGELAGLFVMEDDDYPARPMYADLSVWENEIELTEYRQSYTFTGELSDSANIAFIIDTSTLTQNTTYTIKVTGTDWHGKEADGQTCDFTVDNSVPSIKITAPVQSEGYVYKSNMITFEGTITNSIPIKEVDLKYVDPAGQNVKRAVTFTDQGIVDGKTVWRFAVVLDGAAPDTGVTGPDVSFGDDAWGNEEHVFTFKATSTTGLSNAKSISIRLDNHAPTASFTDATVTINGDPLIIEGAIDDIPPAGIQYPLSFEMLQIALYKNGVPHPDTDRSIIKPFGAGGLNFDGTPMDFAYTWDYSALTLIDDDDYELRIQTRDNAGNTQTIADVMTVIKNENPPLIAKVTYDTTDNVPYKGTIAFTIEARDDGAADTNGLNTMYIKVFDPADNAVITEITKTYTGAPQTVSEVIMLDTTDTAFSGRSEFKVSIAVTDISRTTVEHVITDTFEYDNQAPVLNTLTCYTKNYAQPIERYSTYLSFVAQITDDISMKNADISYRITDKDAAHQVRGTFGTIVNNGTELTASFMNEQYEQVLEFESPITITIDMTDDAGNAATYETTMHKVDPLPGVTLDNGILLANGARLLSAMNDGAPNDTVSITGSVSNAGANPKLTVERRSNTVVTRNTVVDLDVILGRFSYDIPKATIADGEYTLIFTIMDMSTGAQSSVEYPILIDNGSPLPAITAFEAVADAGHVDQDATGYDLSGQVTISGTLRDAYLKHVTDLYDPDLKLTITKGASTLEYDTLTIETQSDTEWTWSFVWDTEALKLVEEGVTITISAYDEGGNQGVGDVISFDIVPYITSITAVAPEHPVYAVKHYQDNAGWENHEDNRAYTVLRRGEAGAPVQIKFDGYNLYANKTHIKYNGFSTTQLTNDFAWTVPAAYSAGSISLEVDNLDASKRIPSTPVDLYPWQITMIGDEDDTLDAYGYDMDLLTDGKAFVTFARDHEVPDDYKNVDDDIHDKCTYRIKEGTYHAYNSFGYIFECFFTASVVYNNAVYMATCIDESEEMVSTGIKKIPVNSSTVIARNQNEANNDFDRTASGGIQNTVLYRNTTGEKDFDTVKSGSLTFSPDHSYLYAALYEDDSKAQEPVPKLRFAAVPVSGGSPAATSRVKLISQVNNPGPWNSVATWNGLPIITYYSAGENKLKLVHGNNADPTSFTPYGGFNDDDIAGGKYCSVAVNTNLVHLVFQDNSNNLRYGIMNIVNGSNTFFNIEEYLDEGITGFNTSLCLADGSVPYISYTNNAQAGSRKALHLARFTGGTPNFTSLESRANWEYMKIPSYIGIDASETVIKWDAANQIPVILFKANDHLYVARMY